MQVSDILRKKGHRVHSIAPERPVLEAARLLAEHGVGALMVLDAEGTVLGIFTERDLVRECAGPVHQLARIPVGEAMTRDLISCHPEDDLRAIEALMRERGFRHLPVLEGRTLVGIVSIRDVLAGLYESAREDANELRDHLAGHYVVC